MDEAGKPGEDVSRRQDEETTPEKSVHDDEPGTKGVENKVGHIVPSKVDPWVLGSMHVCAISLKFIHGTWVRSDMYRCLFSCPEQLIR